MSETTATETKVGQKWLVDLTRYTSVTLDADKLCEEFSSEWADAQARGLDQDDFVRESVDEMGWNIQDGPWVITHDGDNEDIDAYKVPS